MPDSSGSIFHQSNLDYFTTKCLELKNKEQVPIICRHYCPLSSSPSPAGSKVFTGGNPRRSPLNFKVNHGEFGENSLIQEKSIKENSTAKFSPDSTYLSTKWTTEKNLQPLRKTQLAFDSTNGQKRRQNIGTFYLFSSSVTVGCNKLYWIL